MCVNRHSWVTNKKLDNDFRLCSCPLALALNNNQHFEERRNIHQKIKKHFLTSPKLLFSFRVEWTKVRQRAPITLSRNRWARWNEITHFRLRIDHLLYSPSYKPFSLSETKIILLRSHSLDYTLWTRAEQLHVSSEKYGSALPLTWDFSLLFVLWRIIRSINKNY